MIPIYKEQHFIIFVLEATITHTITIERLEFSFHKKHLLIWTMPLKIKVISEELWSSIVELHTAGKGYSK